MSSIIQPLYGSSGQTITCTINSLANNGARASTVIDNSTLLAEDAYIFATIVSAASATSATGYVAIYGYGTVDGGTNYPESITGSDAGITLTVPPNLALIGQAWVVANSHTYKYGPFSFCRAFGLDRLPQKWGVVLVNASGATLASSGNSLIYQLLNGQLT